MSRGEVKYIEYGIKPGGILFSVFSFVVTSFTIYSFIEKYSLAVRAIIILLIMLLTSFVYVVVIFLRLRTVKKIHNNLADKYNHLKTNQKALKDLVKTKNTELDDLKLQNNLLRLKLELLYLCYQVREEPNNLKIIEEVNSIEERKESY